MLSVAHGSRHTVVNRQPINANSVFLSNIYCLLPTRNGQVRELAQDMVLKTTEKPRTTDTPAQDSEFPTEWFSPGRILQHLGLQDSLPQRPAEETSSRRWLFRVKHLMSKLGFHWDHIVHDALANMIARPDWIVGWCRMQLDFLTTGGC